MSRLKTAQDAIADRAAWLEMKASMAARESENKLLALIDQVVLEGLATTGTLTRGEMKTLLDLGYIVGTKAEDPNTINITLPQEDKNE